MTLDPKTPHRPTRRYHRLGLEALETRNLLTTGLSSTVLPVPATLIPAEVSATSKAMSASNSTYDSIIGAAYVRTTYGVDGTGLTAAVIDTGVNYRNAALGGSFGNGSKVVAGIDYGDKDSDPDATTWQHGTHVAGLIASHDPSAPGVAPGADIAALRVFSSQNQGSYEWIAQSLQWVLDNASRYNISVVNLSLSDGGNYQTNPFVFGGGYSSQIKSLIHQLRLANIPVVSAAGNSFNGQQGMGYTAILPETISVTASDGSDGLLSDAQRLGTAQGGGYATDLAAPGYNLLAPAEGQTKLNVSGTSFAAPLVSGSILLLQSIYKKRFGTLPTVDQIEGWLKAGADTIVDATTGITLSRLDVAGSAALIPVPETPGPAPTKPSAPPESPTTEAPKPGSKPENPSPNNDTPSSPETKPPATPPANNGSGQIGSTPGNGAVTPSPSHGNGSGSGSKPLPDRPSETPATPPTTDTGSAPVTGEKNPDATDAALTELYREGRRTGQVASDSQANPMVGAAAAFGQRIRLTKVETWAADGKRVSSSTESAATGGVLTASSQAPKRASAGSVDSLSLAAGQFQTLSVTPVESGEGQGSGRSRWSRLASRLRRR